MDKKQPIFTERAECQDCYKCVRSCPVKAIKLQQGVASVMAEACIYCGTCVNICPSGAKQVRNDLRQVKHVLHSGVRVIASIAPSWASEFPGVTPAMLVNALKQLGFWGVSETALGAQEVSAHVARLLDEHPAACWISSACPVVVEYIKKYHPQHVDKLTGLVSPMLAHTALLKQHYGAETQIVFIGPCIAKKKEADASNGLLAAVLTFEDLRSWLEAEVLLPLQRTRLMADDVFIPQAAEEGALYPIEGGMLTGIVRNGASRDFRRMSLSGMDNVADVLDSLEALDASDDGLFLELLACAGGCINGPKTHQRAMTLPKRLRILEQARAPENPAPRQPVLSIATAFRPEKLLCPVFSEAQVRTILRQTGKFTRADELNCGGCGYNSCREFALAVLEMKAETAMCVSYMRQLAYKKTNKLIKTMPSAVVIVDKHLRIIECNRNFVRVAGPEAEEIFEVHEGLSGAVLERVMPIAHLFQQVLDSGEDLLETELHIKNRVLECSIFSVEEGNIVGGILHDITEPVMKKDEITHRAQQVIRKNLKTVQKIAYLLGENAAETEMTLNAIIEAFNAGKGET